MVLLCALKGETHRLRDAKDYWGGVTQSWCSWPMLQCTAVKGTALPGYVCLLPCLHCTALQVVCDKVMQLHCTELHYFFLPYTAACAALDRMGMRAAATQS